jgi:hypothetical protein
MCLVFDFLFLISYFLFFYFFLLNLLPTQPPLRPHASLMRQLAAVASVCHKRLAVMARQTVEMDLMSLAVVVSTSGYDL